MSKHPAPFYKNISLSSSKHFTFISIAMASIRLLAPRASLTLHSRQLQHRLLLPSIRHASTTTPPKPRVLEKPDRFNPPSHPSRRARPRQYPGPPLSEHERQKQQTRKYPHMMPAEGTFMFKFLTSRAIHMWLSLVCFDQRQLAHYEQIIDRFTTGHSSISSLRDMVQRLLLQDTLSRPPTS